MHNFGKTLRCFLGYFPSFSSFLPLYLGQWIVNKEFVYYQRFLIELPPQRAKFHALDIQLWCLSTAAAGAGKDLLQLEPWSTRHPSGLLKGTQAQPLCFCRRFQKILLPYWCGIEQIRREMKCWKCCLGVPVYHSWHQGVLGILHFVVHVLVKAERLLNMCLSHTDGVKAIWHLLRSSMSNDFSLRYLPVFSQSYFSY